MSRIQNQSEMLLSINGGSPINLGVPTPPRIETPRVPPRLLLSSMLDWPSLRSLAEADSASVHLAGLNAAFSRENLESVEKLVRIVFCAYKP